MPVRLAGGSSVSGRLSPPAKTVDPFYLTKEWRRLTASLVVKRTRRCEACGRTHTKGGKAVRLFADHITELQDGGAPFDPANIQLLCGACHSAKTAQARLARFSVKYTAEGV